MSKVDRTKIYMDRVEWATKLLDETAKGKERIGVEVGLWKADFAKFMLERDKSLHWIGVDPYFEYGKRRRKQKDWNSIHQRVIDKMKPFGDRFTLIRKPSHQGAFDIPDNVDFVFIDGNHDYDVVINDILLYEKKVRQGGIVSGHDYFAPKRGKTRVVQKAVDDCVRLLNTKLNVTNRFDPCGVFWWIKETK